MYFALSDSFGVVSHGQTTPEAHYDVVFATYAYKNSNKYCYLFLDILSVEYRMRLDAERHVTFLQCDYDVLVMSEKILLP